MGCDKLSGLILEAGAVRDVEVPGQCRGQSQLGSRGFREHQDSGAVCPSGPADIPKCFDQQPVTGGAGDIEFVQMVLKALEIGHLRAVRFIGMKVLDAFSDGYGAGFRAGQKEFIKHVLNHGMLLPAAGIQNRGNSRFLPEFTRPKVSRLPLWGVAVVSKMLLVRRASWRARR